MISRVSRLAAFAAAVCLAPVVPTLSSTAAGATVEVVDMSFTPSRLTISLGDTVTWSFQDSAAHTSTSDQGFWDSGSKAAGATFAHTFTSAGSYAYHCTFHSMMRGTVRVPLAASGTSSTGWRVRWATVKGTGSRTYDVQVRKPGAHRWTTLRDDVSKASMSYHPATPGTYRLRARTNNGSSSSGWSPAKLLTVS